MTSGSPRPTWRNFSHDDWAATSRDQLGARPYAAYMNEHTVDKEKMDALKALADTNMKVSEAQNALFKIQQEETTYVVAREARAVKAVQRVLEESRDLVAETKQNYQDVEDLAVTTGSFADKVMQMADDLERVAENFDNYSIQWEREADERLAEMKEIRKGLDTRAHLLDNEKKALDARTLGLNEREKKIRDREGVLERKITRLNEKKL